ncbi:MAG TPA: hypothetical protein VGN93_27905 [Shinella sp.]|jgi:hypothetical protein|uniref:hypothetical protein n=1 Tax=Shinella sp. TaxID=1870904 RepID=UPI002E105B13|nr:hypothetical protein [Shinella sp.]
MHFLLRALFSACLLVSTTAHADDDYPVRDIRKVVVSGDDSVPNTVLKRTGEHLKRAAKATRRPVQIDRAAMDIRVSGVKQAGDGHSSAKVTVTLADLGGGASSRKTLTVNSFMPARKGREAALGDAIARRVALAYHLAPVAKGKVAHGKRPGKGRKYAGGKRRTATVRSVQAYSGTKRALVIPSEAALTVRSRALAEGSTKKVAPCVVTQSISCD